MYNILQDPRINIYSNGRCPYRTPPTGRSAVIIQCGSHGNACVSQGWRRLRPQGVREPFAPEGGVCLAMQPPWPQNGCITCIIRLFFFFRSSQQRRCPSMGHCSPSPTICSFTIIRSTAEERNGWILPKVSRILNEESALKAVVTSLSWRKGEGGLHAH